MQTEHITNRYFRAGVGTVIYREDGQLAWFKRAKYPIGIWQFQQGGIDLGETIETTLWRELREEVGLTAEDIAQIFLQTTESSTEPVTDMLLLSGQPYQLVLAPVKAPTLIAWVGMGFLLDQPWSAETTIF